MTLWLVHHYPSSGTRDWHSIHIDENEARAAYTSINGNRSTVMLVKITQDGRKKIESRDHPDA